MKLPVWSYTFLSTYELCPRKAEAIYVNKNYPRDGESAALRWGNAVHDAMEHRINSNQRLPDDMQQWEQFGAKFANKGIQAEMKLGVDKNYNPCGFFDSNVYGRCKIDVPVLINDEAAAIFDWKTGKSNYEDPMELKINAVLLKAKYPELKEIYGAYAWLKEDRWGELYDLSDTASTIEWIEETMAKAERSNFWAPRKNALCGWCNLKTCPNYKDRKDDSNS